MMPTDMSFTESESFLELYGEGIRNGSSSLRNLLKILGRCVCEDYRNSRGCVLKFHVIPLHCGISKDRVEEDVGGESRGRRWRRRGGYALGKDIVIYMRPRDYLRCLVLQVLYFGSEGKRPEVSMMLQGRLDTTLGFPWNVFWKGDYPLQVYEKFEKMTFSARKCLFNESFLYGRMLLGEDLGKYGYPYGRKVLVANWRRNVSGGDVHSSSARKNPSTVSFISSSSGVEASSLNDLP